MPVVSMSMRPLDRHGPGIADARGMRGRAFISLISSSGEMVSGVICRSTGVIHSGRPAEYQVSHLAPFRTGLEGDHRFQHGQRRGIGGVSARPAFPSTRSTSGNCLKIRVGGLKELLRLPDRNARHGGRHVEKRTLVEWRHELRSK